MDSLVTSRRARSPRAIPSERSTRSGYAAVALGANMQIGNRAIDDVSPRISLAPPQRLAAHVRASGNHQHTTVSEHMPSSHRRYAGWTIERIRADARLIGPAMAALCELILEARPHPEQGFRAWPQSLSRQSVGPLPAGAPSVRGPRAGPRRRTPSAYLTQSRGADLLILDDWGLEPLDAAARHDLLEIFEERYRRRSTVITSQLPVDRWHEIVGEPTLS
jgi:hypothetical protein